MKALGLQLAELCHKAGDAILDIYADESRFGIETKADNSPVTRADLAANAIIQAALPSILDIPILTEEQQAPNYSVRKNWQRYWLVDPLDGTKEFIHRNGEFTVNIALIEHHRPRLGVVYAPVLDTTYIGVKDVGAWKIERGAEKSIQTRSLGERQQGGLPLSVVASRRHGLDVLEQVLAPLRPQFADVECVSVGSSLKFCLLAEGGADFYPRTAPTCEWDTAAGQAVLEAAGGVVLDNARQPLLYNRHDILLNPHFYAIADPDTLFSLVAGNFELP